ncbi:MAG: hypothetical protein HY062_06950 [Bacteroidetes bacterium]|nr:hypothetical protein [Bacteroidota bacterium]
MKTILFYISLAPIIAFGQTTEPAKASPASNPLKYELGFNLFSLTDLHKGDPYYTSKSYDYSTNLFSGIFVKRHFNKNVVRFSYDYNHRVVNEKHEAYPWYSKATGDVKLNEFRLGYEREFSSKKLVPFLSTDLCYNYSKAKGISSAYGDFDSYQDQEYLIERNEYSVCVGSGLKYNLAKNITLVYEFNVQTGYYHSQNLKNNLYNYFDEGQFFRFNPVRQLGISIKF